MRGFADSSAKEDASCCVFLVQGCEMGRHALELYTQTKNVIVKLG